MKILNIMTSNQKSYTLLLIISFLLFIFCQKINAQSRSNKGTNYALVVGISNYKNVNPLLYADDDAELFADYLKKEGICYKNGIILLIDSNATRANIFLGLQKILTRVKANDRVFIYFAGHGDVESDIETGFLLPYDCEKTNYAATSIEISMVEKYVKSFTNKQAGVILITDACRSGNLAGGINGATYTMASILNGFNNTVKILSCQPSQFSKESKYTDGGHGIFTYHLIDGLKGLADKNNDKLISLREIDLYLDSVAFETNQSQIPKVDGNPSYIISDYKDSIKYALSFRKSPDNRSIVNANRNTLLETDTNWYYVAFQNCLKANKLIFPKNDNAYTLIRNANSNNIKKELLENMQFEFIAYTDDYIQKEINKYVRAEDYEKFKNHSCKDEILQLMDSSISLMNHGDTRYIEFQAKRLFFKSIHARCNQFKFKFDSLINELTLMNKNLPNQAWIIHELGNLYSESHKYDSAMYYHNKALLLAPDWVYPLANIGWDYHLMGNDSLALVYLNKCIDIDSTIAWPIGSIGEIYWNQGNTPKAIPYILKALQLNPNDIHELQILGAIKEDINDISMMDSLYMIAFKIDSTQKETLLGCGIAKQKKGQYEMSEYYFKKAIEIDSLFFDSWYQWGLTKELMNDKNAAASKMLKALNINPIFPVVWSKIYNFNISLDKKLIQQAYNKLKIIITEDSTNIDALLTIAAVEAYFFHELTNSEHYILKAWSLNSKDPSLAYNIACFFSITKNLQKSTEFLDDAINLGFRNFELIEKDPDLSNIRTTKTYKDIIKKYKKKKV